MIAVDTNVLVYAHRADSPFHQRSAHAVRQLAEGHADWAIPWPCVHEFLSVVTHRRIYQPPSRPEQALDQLRAWAASPSLRFIGEGPGHLDTIASLVLAGAVTGPKVHDARIAAICLTNGVSELLSLDRDFTRFPDLTTRSPLAVDR